MTDHFAIVLVQQLSLSHDTFYSLHRTKSTAFNIAWVAHPVEHN